MPKVTFVNELVTVEAQPGETLLSVGERGGINVFRGIFQGLHCKRVRGWCGRCKVWATPLQSGALNEKTGAELRVRLGGRVAAKGTMRLACQAVVSGDVEVRTRPGFEIKETLTWDADARKSKWKERWDKRAAPGAAVADEPEADADAEG